MKFLTKPLFAFMLVLLAIGAFVYQQSDANLPEKTIAEVVPIQPISTELEEEGEGEEQKRENAKERMEQAFEQMRDPKTNEVPVERLLAASRVATQLLNQPNRSDVGKLDWEERGPDNVGGRTRAVLVDAADPTNNTVLAGGVNGGIWKTTNFLSAEPTWTKNNDFFDNLAVSSIVQDPNDPSIIYFGTGEGWFNGDAARGLGIWKSTKGGDNFFPLASTANRTFHYVMDLEIDHNGALYAATANGGVQRSTDGGESWSQVLGASSGQAHNIAADLEIAANGDLYATMGRIFSAGSIWKSSVNKGAFQGQRHHWQEITPAGSFWRMEMAVAPSNPWTLYAVAEGEGSFDAEHFFHSMDGGKTWIEKPAPTIYDQGRNPNFTRGQAWYDLIIAVHPEKEGDVYMAGVDMVRTRDGGDTWEQVSDWTANRPGNQAPGLNRNQYVHADIHEIIFLPNRLGEEIIVGTDGGIFHGTGLNYQDRLPIFRSRNSGYNITQYYSVALHPTQGSNYFLAGSQDNGTQRYNAPGMNSTVEATGGDGGFCHIDQNNPLIQVTSFTGTSLSVSQNGGKSFGSFFGFGGGSFINPTDYDNDTGVFYAGFADGAILRWAGLGAGRQDADLVFGFQGVVTAVTAAPNTPNRVWIGVRSRGTGTSIAYIEAAASAAPSVVTLTPPADMFPGVTISCIEVDPNDAGHLLVTVTNYGVTSVYEVSGADTAAPEWNSVEGSLPDMPVRWALFYPGDSDKALIATELGVWGTQDLDGGQTHWIPTNKGLAHTRVDMLQRRASDGLIAAATHGRGLFTTGGIPATCNDGIQNGDEQDVDCGGSNCAPCNDYCTAGAAASHFFGIGRVAMNAFENVTGNDAGYGDYTHLTIPLNPGENIFFEVDPNGDLADFPLYYTLWIDYNKDQDFDDAGEQVFQSMLQNTGTLYQTFTIPEGLTGETRMRISMSFFGPAGPCDGYLAGETEDYTVHFSNCGIPQEVTCTGLFGNKVLFGWQEVYDATSYELEYRVGNSFVWESIETTNTNYTLFVGNNSVTYRLRSICPAGPSVWSDAVTFGGRTGFTPDLADENTLVNTISKVYPNPIQSTFNLAYVANETAHLTIFDASGKLVYQRGLAETAGGVVTEQIRVADFARGFYLLKLQIGQEVFTEQLVKQ